MAIGFVFLYHYQIPPFTGGLIGVDVFFVISGFVITGLLLREQDKTPKNALADFYARRSRRILPAATSVILAVVAAAYLFVGSQFGAHTANDGRWSAAFLANVHIIPGSLSAFGNYWSLAVEEQFYLLYPTLILLLATLKTRISLRGRIAIALTPIVIASLAVCVAQDTHSSSWMTNSLLARSWELALGALVAITTSYWKRLPAGWSAALVWSGIAAITIGAVTFNGEYNYPGFEAILPAVGAALTILGGTSVPKYGAERLLGSSPFRWLGQRSYSLYLWHWPIIIIAGASGLAVTLHLKVWTAWQLRIPMMAVSVLLSMATYRWIENPIRRMALPSKRSILLGLGLVIGTILLLTLAILGTPSPKGLA